MLNNSIELGSIICNATVTTYDMLPITLNKNIITSL